MNETITNILERRSIRKYKDTPVSMDDLELIAKCGEYAATGMGRQPWHFTIVTSRDYMDRVTEANRQIMLASPDEMPRKMAASPDFDGWRGAPVAIVVSGEGGEASACDCANATENMAIAAQSLGLGSCYLGSFKIAMVTPEYASLKDELGLPEGYEPLYALAIGYADEAPEAHPRKEGSVSYIK
jgi:nitroreductase